MTGYVGPTKLDPSEQRVLKKPFTIAELAGKVEELLFPATLPARQGHTACASGILTYDVRFAGPYLGYSAVLKR
jgi:hypothetical protein